MPRNSTKTIAALIGLCLMLILVACGPQASSGSSAAATSAPNQPQGAVATAVPKAGPKILKMARNAEPFSPFIPWQIDDNPALFISVNVYDTLLRTTKDGLSVEPALATKWESSADGLTWTFTLRDNVKFSDGTPMKASDFKTSLDIARGGEKSGWKDNYKAIKEIQAPDDKTLKIILSQPYAPLLSVLAMFSGAVLPTDLAKASDAKDFNNDSAWKTRGTGAYMVDGWKKGDVLVLKKNPNYWKANATMPDEVRIEFVPDDNARLLKLRGGEVNLVDFVPFSQVASLGAEGKLKAQTFTIQQASFVIMNTEKKPLDDVKVRQALNYATDKDAVIKVVYFGQAKVANSPIPPGTHWDKNLPGYPYNVDKAKELMKASSVPNGFTLDLQTRGGNTNDANLATLLKDQWAKIGVTVNIQQLESSAVRANTRSGAFVAVPSAWTNDMNDPTQLVNYQMRGGASPFAYWTRYNNASLNDKITKADLEQDVAKRATAYSEIQKIYLDDAPLVFLAYLGATAGWQDSVDGFVIDGLSYYRFEDVKLK